jgi:hypothetical protein
MPENKIGSDILGQGGLRQGGSLGEKRRQEMLEKMREEKAKKKAGQLDELNGHEIPREATPGEHPPEPKPGTGPDRPRDVHVSEHKRRKPARKGVNTFFERQAEKIREG